MISIQYDDREILAALEQLIQNGTNLAPAFQDIGEYLVVSTRERFERGEAPDGTPWAANSPTTLARKRSTKPGIGETRQLSTRIHAQSNRDGVSVGSPMEQAGTFQLGARKGQYGNSKRGPVPWGNIPARPFIGMSKDDEQQVLAIVQEYLLS